MLGKHERAINNYANVTCWGAVSGETADLSKSGQLIERIPTETINNPELRNLVRGVGEAISNAVDHAYPDTEVNGDRWWMFTATNDTHLTVIVCDLGVGIPCTLPFTQEPSVLNSIKVFLGLGESPMKDGNLIQISTYIKQSRTKASHRGKGGQDMRTIIERLAEDEKGMASGLNIFSNCGRLRITKSKKADAAAGKKTMDITSDHKTSILGTIVEWNIRI